MSLNVKKTETEPIKRKTTRTGLTASTIKIKKLKTRKQMQNSKKKLPRDYQVIAEGCFAEMSEITPEVYLTGIFGLIKENFEEHKINYVINVSYEAPDIEIKGITTIRLLADDDAEEDLFVFFDWVSEYIDNAIKKGGHIVVHCMAGVSRSATIVMAYLMRYKNMSLKHGFKMVVDKRNVVKPIPNFIRQLMAYERKIRGTNSFQIVKHKKDGVSVHVPDFWIKDFPNLVQIDIELEKLKLTESGHRVSVSDGNGASVSTMTLASDPNKLTQEHTEHHESDRTTICKHSE